MRAGHVCFAACLLANSAALTESPKRDSAIVAAYDAILADVTPEQTTIALGDMIVPVDTVRLWRDQLADAAPSSAAAQTGVNLWPGGNVYYVFDANVSASHQAAFLDGVREWEAFGNVHFIPRTAEANYIRVSDGGPGMSGGTSAVGMIGGEQQLTIGSTSWNRPTIVHESGHALGLIHEHQRSDRDTYVTINFSNVPGGASDGNFILIPGSTNHGAYDFLSVMHYGRKTLAVNPAIDTITPQPAYMQFIDIMGNPIDRVLSRGDRDGIAAMYGPGPAISTVVMNTQDSGAGSLRTAIYRAFDIATDTPGATPTITFQIPNTDPNFSGGVFTIQPSDHLPAPGPGTTIDGTTQAAFTGDTNPSGPEIVLNGTLQNDPSTYGLGLRLSAANVTVKGLVINAFSTQGILITGAGATGNTVSGCYIGTNAAGAAAAANVFAGVEINDGATNNTIGGTSAAARNVISGNSAQGVFIRGAGTNGNAVRGNYLGLNAAGAGALANGFSGIEIGEGAGGNTIGGTTAGSGNVISGNSLQGVFITGAGTAGNLVRGNYIGLTAGGTSALANGFSGVEIADSANNNTVGGSVAGAGNVISGNTYQGILVNGTHNHIIAGNFIGTNAVGTAAVANGFAGVEIGGAGQGNTVGGAVAAARNVISGNSAQGVYIHSTGSDGNVVAGNHIGTNTTASAAVPNLFAGVEIGGGAQNNVIGGVAAGSRNILSGNSSQGVAIQGVGTSNNIIAGNYVGTNSTGNAAIPNAYAGVAIFNGATGNTVGGTAAGAGNLLSGNSNQGVYISQAGTNNNAVLGNLIGTNAAGAAALPNGFAGAEIGGGAQNNVIGGATAMARNVLSGNTSQGVVLEGSGTSGNRVKGNYIGVNAAGTAALANGFPGVEIFNGASANTIGGAAPGEGNVISGNSFGGVTIIGANGNGVAGNLIGLNAAGAAALPNAGAGIQIFGGAQANTIGGTSGGRNFIAGNNGAGITISGNPTNGNVVAGNSIGTTPDGAAMANANEGIALFADVSGGPQGNIIGGSAPGAANSISGNTGAGIALYNDGTTGNRISGNSITGNGWLGIDLWGDGSTPNDANDSDTGPNDLQNFPSLTSAVLGTSTVVSGALNSTAGAAFRIEFFENAAADASGFGEGRNFIGSINVITNGSGNATINTALPAIVPAGRVITAVAIHDSGGNTSEFSAGVIVTTTDTDGDGLPDAYEIANGLSTGIADANADADGDGMTNWQEFRARTDPRNQASLLKISPLVLSGNDMSVSLPTVLGITYRIDYADDLFPPASWRVLADQIPGTGSPIIIMDPGVVALPRRFYRATVEP